MLIYFLSHLSLMITSIESMKCMSLDDASLLSPRSQVIMNYLFAQSTVHHDLVTLSLGDLLDSFDTSLSSTKNNCSCSLANCLVATVTIRVWHILLLTLWLLRKQTAVVKVDDASPAPDRWKATLISDQEATLLLQSLEARNMTP